MILVNGRKIDTTTDGYLARLEDWSEEVAVYLSERDNVLLTDGHWRVINVVRQYFKRYGITPNLRTLQKLLREEFGEEQAHMLELFDYGDAAKQAARYAGTPKPTGCI
ncbi:MAG TPA: TusE/DsrC/DsvC family sulfur relay protein [Rhodocyclaceae bacterium]|nr:TusE/DsrC/DsvC family sulfur relay protein [Rhodocyclaceae bacterium]